MFELFFLYEELSSYVLEKPPAFQSEHPAVKNMKILQFFLF